MRVLGMYACAVVLAARAASSQPLRDLWNNGHSTTNDTDRTLKHLLHRKVWFLMYAGSSSPDAPAPTKKCIRVSVTETKQSCYCVINTFNHTVHEVKIYKLVGLDRNNVTVINTIAPAHGRFAGAQNRGMLTAPSLIKGSICWSKGTRKLWPFHYVVWGYNVNVGSKRVTGPDEYHLRYLYIYLVGINMRKSAPEYQTLLLSPYDPSTLHYTFTVNYINFHDKFHTNFLPRLNHLCYPNATDD